MNCNNEQLNFTCGGDQQLYVTLRREGQAFPAELSDDVVLNIVSDRAERINVSFQLGDDGRLIATLPGEQFRRPGSYGVEVVGLLNGTKWRAWRKRCIRYTPDTQPAATRSTEQQADPYDITIDVGLVQDIIPRRTSELVNDGEDGNDPFAKAGDVAEVLKHYAPLRSPEFEGIPRGNDIEEIQSGYATTNTRSPLTTFGAVKRIIAKLKGAVNGLASLGSDGKVPVAQIPDLPYIPSNKKGAAGGVAELNGDGKIPTAQAQFALRGNLVAADIDSTALQSGFYRVIGQRLGADILGGDEANGVLIQYSDGYKEQVLMVGRAAGAAAGEQVETYTRRYLPTPKRWTAWSKGGGSDDVLFVRFTGMTSTNMRCSHTYAEIQTAVIKGKAVIASTDEYDQPTMTMYQSGSTAGSDIIFNRIMLSTLQECKVIITSDNKVKVATGSYRYFVDIDEAKKGTSTTYGYISPKVLKDAIVYHTSNKANTEDVYTKTEADERFQPKGNYLTEHQDISGKQDVQQTAVYTADSTAADFRPMQLGTVADGGTQYTLYRFLYRTEALPANSSMEIDLSALMGDYAVKEWTSADGFVDSHKMSSERTDNLNNVCIIQQLTKSTKKLYLRTYADLSAKTALLQLEFYGAKAVPIG